MLLDLNVGRQASQTPPMHDSSFAALVVQGASETSTASETSPVASQTVTPVGLTNAAGGVVASTQPVEVSPSYPPLAEMTRGPGFDLTDEQILAQFEITYERDESGRLFGRIRNEEFGITAIVPVKEGIGPIPEEVHEAAIAQAYADNLVFDPEQRDQWGERHLHERGEYGPYPYSPFHLLWAVSASVSLNNQVPVQVLLQLDPYGGLSGGGYRTVLDGFVGHLKNIGFWHDEWYITNRFYNIGERAHELYYGHVEAKPGMGKIGLEPQFIHANLQEYRLEIDPRGDFDQDDFRSRYADPEVLATISAVASGQEDIYVSPFQMMANAGNQDFGNPAYAIARQIREAVVNIGAEYVDTLSERGRQIVAKGGPESDEEANYILNEFYTSLSDNSFDFLMGEIKNEYEIDLGLDWLAAANDEYSRSLLNRPPALDDMAKVRQSFGLQDPIDSTPIDTGAQFEPARPPLANAWLVGPPQSSSGPEVLAQQFASQISATIRTAALPLASHKLSAEMWDIIKRGPASLEEATAAIHALFFALPDDERQAFTDKLPNALSIDFTLPQIGVTNAQIPRPDGMSEADWRSVRQQLGIRDLDHPVAMQNLQGLSQLTGDERIAQARELAVGIARAGLTTHQTATQLREVFDRLSEDEVLQIWPAIADIARFGRSTAEFRKLIELLDRPNLQEVPRADFDETLVASAGSFDLLVGTPPNDQLDPEMRAMWEFMQGVATETVGNVMGEISAPPSTAFSDAARRVDDLMAFVGPLLPPEARNVIRVAAAAAPVADGIASFDQKVSLAIAALNALPLGENFDTAIDFASLGLQMKQFFANPDLVGGASLLANLIGRGVGPKTAATIETVARGVELAAAPTPQNFAKFAWSAVNLSQMYDQVRIGMGETSVAGGAMADVTFMGHTNSRGPEYRYVLAGDQPNLPALNRAVFDLIERPDGSFAFSGKGFRDPLSIDSDILGEMTTPGVIAGLDGFLHLKRGPDNMHNDFLIDGDLARLLMEHNGGNTRFDVNADWSAFPEIEALFDRFQLDATYFEPAKGGMLSELDFGDPLAVRTFPHVPGVEGYDDRIVAAFRQPGMMDHRFTFRDLESAAIFQAAGQGILSRIASDPALIAQFGPPRDIQGMIDFMFANPDLPVPEDPFDAFAYLAANPDLQEHFDERDVIGLSLHYVTAGHFEGRSRHAGEAETFRELERYLAFTVFDEDVYRALYPDVAAAVDAGEFADAREHFRAFGFDEGRLPNFNGEAYLAANPGLAEALAETGVTALQHYVLHGRAEGRPLAPPAPEIPKGYDETLYLQQNPDVAEAVETGQIASGLEHFLNAGQAEGRSPGGATAAEALPEGFDAADYMNTNPDILEAGIESGRPLDEYAIDHFMAFGKDEGRWHGGAEIVPAAEAPAADPLPEGFDAAVYMDKNPDILEAGIESGRPLDEYAIEHFAAFGKDEGRAYA